MPTKCLSCKHVFMEKETREAEIVICGVPVTPDAEGKCSMRCPLCGGKAFVGVPKEEILPVV